MPDQDGFDQDPITRLKRILSAGVKALEDELAELDKNPKTEKSAAKRMTVLKDTAVLMGHIRRQDIADRAAGRGLTPSTVIEYLRGLSPEARAHIRNEVDWDGEEAGPAESVLS